MSKIENFTGVDFHCHLDLYPDHEAAISRAESSRVYTLAVTTTPKAWPRNRDLTSKTQYVRAALGLHPQLVAERADEFSLWESHLPETRYVGEVGLDAGPRYYKSLEIQRQIFQAILERCSQAGGKILTVHSVRSATAVLDLIEAHLPRDRGTIVLHWFTGSKSEARRATALGCYFSVNLEMLRSDRGASLISDLPMDRVLTETDGPFTQIGGRSSEPVDVNFAVEAIAKLRGIAVEDVSRIIKNNLQALLR